MVGREDATGSRERAFSGQFPRCLLKMSLFSHRRLFVFSQENSSNPTRPCVATATAMSLEGLKRFMLPPGKRKGGEYEECLFFQGLTSTSHNGEVGQLLSTSSSPRRHNDNMTHFPIFGKDAPEPEEDIPQFSFKTFFSLKGSFTRQTLNNVMRFWLLQGNIHPTSIALLLCFSLTRLHILAPSLAISHRPLGAECKSRQNSIPVRQFICPRAC